MKIIEEKINELKLISIRARYAYFLLSLEENLNEENLNEKIFQKALAKLWEFTSCNDLGEWQHQVEDLLPSYILNEGISNDEYVFLSLSDVEGLRLFYKRMPNSLVVFLEDIIWLGFSPIYAKRERGNDDSIRLTSTLLKILYAANLDIRKLGELNKRVFEGDYYLGDCFAKNDLFGAC